MKNKLIANVMLFSTAIIWGFAFVAQVLGSENAPSAQILEILYQDRK